MEMTWTGAVCLLGGNQEVAAAAAADLSARYAEPHRRYHDNVHVQAVLRDAAALAGELRLSAEDRAVLAVAAGAHDVVYDGHPGDDERRSASWARDWLTRAGVGEAREEYAFLDERAWRAGRAAVMSGLLARDPLYGTGAARRRWEAMARANIARELESL